jgi:hypothetical protein
MAPGSVVEVETVEGLRGDHDPLGRGQWGETSTEPLGELPISVQHHPELSYLRARLSPERVAGAAGDRDVGYPGRSALVARTLTMVPHSHLVTV